MSAPSIRVNLYRKRGKLDFVGWMLGVQQRSAITHACIQIDDTCWTTGARWHWMKGWVFGPVLAEQYNQGRQYYSCEFSDSLTADEAASLLAVCQAFEGQRYGMWKVIKLATVGNLRADFICELGKVDLVVKNPFCSEHVVFACWQVGRRVCEWLCRKEPSVCTPHDLYLEAIRPYGALKVAEVIGGVF